MDAIKKILYSTNIQNALKLQNDLNHSVMKNAKPNWLLIEHPNKLRIRRPSKELIRK